MAIIDYDAEPAFAKSLEIEDIGNCCIRGTNESDFSDYYIAVQSVSGFAYILKLGPVTADLEDEALEEFSLEYKKIKYSSKKIEGEIAKFLNDSKKFITNAELVDLDDALNSIPDGSAFVPF